MIKQELKRRVQRSTCSNTETTINACDASSNSVSETTTNSSTETQRDEKSIFANHSFDQLLSQLHTFLIKCQNLGDQKVKLSSQIIETFTNKTRQLGLDIKSNGNFAYKRLAL